MKELPEKIRKVLEVDAKVLKVAEVDVILILIFILIVILFTDLMMVIQELYEKRSLLIMGRGYNYATCLEGALKVNDHDDEWSMGRWSFADTDDDDFNAQVKELTYMHSEGIQVSFVNEIVDKLFFRSKLGAEIMKRTNSTFCLGRNAETRLTLTLSAG